jgi:very-short-patch-repair endonuclease
LIPATCGIFLALGFCSVSRVAGMSGMGGRIQRNIQLPPFPWTKPSPGLNHPGQAGLAKRGIKGDFIKSTMLDYNQNLKRYSQTLRKNITKAEIRLWSRLREKQFSQVQFYRQKIIGNYIVDFYCPKANLVIELDGGQHYSEEGRYKDKQRDNYLQSQGLYVMRFSDREVFENLEGILTHIADHLGGKSGEA